MMPFTVNLGYCDAYVHHEIFRHLSFVKWSITCSHIPLPIHRSASCCVSVAHVKALSHFGVWSPTLNCSVVRWLMVPMWHQYHSLLLSAMQLERECVCVCVCVVSQLSEALGWLGTTTQALKARAGKLTWGRSSTLQVSRDDGVGTWSPTGTTLIIETWTAVWYLLFPSYFHVPIDVIAGWCCFLEQETLLTLLQSTQLYKWGPGVN